MSVLLGQLTGLKKKALHQLEKLAHRGMTADQMIQAQLVDDVALLSLEIKRPISLVVDRPGRIGLVYVGSVADMGEDPEVFFPRGRGLSGRRVISTVFNPITGLDIGGQTTMMQHRLDAVITVLATDRPEFSPAFGEHPKAADQLWVSSLLAPDATADDAVSRLLSVVTASPVTLHQCQRESFEAWCQEQDEALAVWFDGLSRLDDQEYAFLMGLAESGPAGKDRAEDLLDELSLLAKTAGAQVVGRLTQTRSQPDPLFYVGKGKAVELAFQVQQHQANLVIADDELSSTQQRQLERVLRTRVVDRTELILDIFAQRAQSWEGKIQVELAQLQYLLPRLAGKGIGFSQQSSGAKGGGIATRGPGETKLELDRRRLRGRITDLEAQAETVKKQRRTQRQARQKSGLPLVALVGYTNAGKSTLLNTLTQAGTLAEDKLFATLDPLTRKLVRPDMSPCLLSDTVGFIQKLPTALVKAFRATLEEIQTASLIFHVVDLSHPDRLLHIQAVDETLALLDASDTPQWLLLNKADKLDDANREAEALAVSLADDRPVYVLSARDLQGVETLLGDLGEFLDAAMLATYGTNTVESEV